MEERERELVKRRIADDKVLEKEIVFTCVDIAGPGDEGGRIGSQSSSSVAVST